jgi:hypothetical protein
MAKTPREIEMDSVMLAELIKRLYKQKRKTIQY